MSARSVSSPSCTSNHNCYFSIPLRNTYDETPLYTSSLTDDHIPMASLSPSEHITNPPHYRMDASRLLQLQTQASTGYFTSRPQPQPVQNILRVEDSPASSPESEDSSMSPPLSARCSRCQRTLSIDVNAGKVSYGLNLYYCSRCAEMVGYNR